MMDFFEHIDDYLSGRLSEEDRKLFEEELKSNEALRVALGDQEIVASAIDLLIEEDIRKVIADDDIKVIDINPKNDGSRRRWIGIAASLLLILGAYYFINPFGSPSQDDLYAEYFSDFLPPTTRGDNDVAELSICDRAHYLMTEGDLSNPKLILEEHVASEEDDCTDKSQWYLMLIYLKSGDVEKRNKLLAEIIADVESIYAGRAKELSDNFN